MRTAHLLSGSLALHLAHAQFPPKREGVTVIKSKFHENVTISFKEPGICETTPGVKSYSGYVHLPPNLVENDDQDFPINTFFWFFEARKDPHNAPLAIWLNGGPGGSSMMGLLEENGPCFVTGDSKSTYLNPWSWNNEVNMLYIDQPVGTGFSYDVLTNVTIQEWISELGDYEPRITPTDFSDGNIPATNYTYRIGTLGSNNMSHTSNTTERAAHAMWHFLQAWLFEFPHYKPNNNKVSLWAESYGGHYGPGFMRFFQDQNEKTESGKSEHEGAQLLHLDTLGLVNAAVDWPIEIEACIDFPYKNTYGLQYFNESFHNELVHNWTEPGGWRDKLVDCTERVKKDPSLNNSTAPDCFGYIDDAIIGKCFGTYLNVSGHSLFDIAHPWKDPFPPPYLNGYLTQESVLSALGVPVNYTGIHMPTNQVFMNTLDPIRGNFMESIAYLLDHGVKVAMMYGDRDVVVNWIGGEKVSLTIPYSKQKEFAKAGYAEMFVSDGKSHSGMTRQHGNFSFTRVFQAGHEVPAYQPEASYEIFMRATFGRDVATGLVKVTDGYATEGPRDTWHVRQVPPEEPKPRCYVLQPGTCEDEVWERVRKGEVVVRDFFVVDDDEEVGRHHDL
ncbi:serine carboxypeptidase [Cladorrhinum sp. PSN259]|nr:serine carboxypeptidase [Cladorrhinum sp. PSN259]